MKDANTFGDGVESSKVSAMADDAMHKNSPPS